MMTREQIEASGTDMISFDNAIEKLTQHNVQHENNCAAMYDGIRSLRATTGFDGDVLHYIVLEAQERAFTILEAAKEVTL